MPDPFQAALEHHQAGRLREAEALYRRALIVQPRNSHAMYLLAAIAQQDGRTAEAVALMGRAIALAPQIAEYHQQLGSFLMVHGQHAKATEEFRTALRQKPDLIDARANLGTALYMNGELAGSIEEFEKFLAARPQSPEILNNLGTALRESGRASDAIAAYRKALVLRPDAAVVWQNLGHALRDVKDSGQAVEAYRTGLNFDVNNPELHRDLGAALWENANLDGALEAIEKSLRLRPNWTAGLQILGGLQHATGRFDQVLKTHGQLLEHGGDARRAGSLLHALYFNPACTPERIFADHARWNRYVRSLAPESGVNYPNSRDPDRRLRVGYLSPDFRLHASSLFTVPLLSNRDRGEFEVFCYCDVIFPDDLTEAHRRQCDVWRPVAKLGDERIAKMIGADQIDVLVDLSLHAAGNRMLVFARKAAPLQLTWLAYPGTSGLETMDYRVSDPYLDPPGLDEQWYSENTVRLPDCFWCYDPLDEQPAVNELPALENGSVTFGSLNNFAKITPQTIELWARVLSAVEKSRMIVLAPRGQARARFAARMQEHGVDAARIEFVTSQPRTPYLATFHRIDICLDTWPCPGHTTTLDSLWMGVPVVTRPGSTAMSRGGVSILSNLGRSEWIARTPEGIIEIAVSLAGDLEALSEVRGSLRQQMRRSVLMDAPRFARNMEAIYRSIWREWCTRSSPR
jgi:predicted O-linked N-acetylglucosamine transferase (SPINDLY family)